MRQFRFRAQSALDLRRKVEEAAERALAVAQAAVRAAEEGTASADRALKSATERANESTASATGAHELIWYRNWILSKRAALADRRRAEQQRRAEAHHAAEALIKARRERKALELLRDKAWRAHVQTERRNEQKDLDLLGAISHGIRRTGGGGHE
jgi:flagellar protein FliJ